MPRPGVTEDQRSALNSLFYPGNATNSRSTSCNRIKEPTVSLNRTVFAYGSTDGMAIYGHMVLMPEGKIYGYSHPNEFRYVERPDGGIDFFNVDGGLSCVFDVHGDSFLGREADGLWGLFLVPVISLSGSSTEVVRLGPRPHASPCVLINSIPKSGTYFVERILSDLGFASTRLHLSGANVCDDNRHIPDELMHVQPTKLRRMLPLHFVARLLAPGEVVVGHIELSQVVQQFRDVGVHVISLKRNLRDVLASLYYFKLSRVSPLSLGDETWRTVGKNDKFLAFLSFFADSDIRHIKQMGMLMAETPNCLAYEDLLEKKREPVDLLRDILGLDCQNEELSSVIEAATQKITPTSNPTRSSWHNIWDERAEKFFERSGLKATNISLGYEY